MTAAAANDPQLDRFLEQIRRQYESDAGFKEQVRESVKTQSESFFKSVIERSSVPLPRPSFAVSCEL